MTERAFLSGNEAIARGAFEAGVVFGSGYPGTPSTEILETLREYPEVIVEWAPNEKVALEAVMGAAFCGARVLMTTKHVGLNVAADPLMTLAYTGIRGGLVIANADDPGMHSSQNEQDNRHYARFAKIPMLEPSDSEEARAFTKAAFEISEQFETPVILRVNTRICHAKGVVNLENPRRDHAEFHFERDPTRWVMVPGYARKRHAAIEDRLKKLAAFSESTPLNREEPGTNGKIGILTSSVSYHYVKEVFPEASVLKLGFSYPIPERKIREFASRHEKIFVVEELDPFLYDQVRALGIALQPRPADWLQGELDPRRVALGLGLEVPEEAPAKEMPPRLPVLCPGCPHRAAYVALKKLKIVATGDIGCYTLGALPPLSNVDTCVCMGAGLGHAHGFSKVLSEEERRKVVAVIGDSTFVHSGITSLANIVYNRAPVTVLILDNRTTAMTGRQDHPGTGKTIRGEETNELDYEALCRALGVRDVRTLDPLDQAGLIRALEEATAKPEPSVLILRSECLLIHRPVRPVMAIDRAACTECSLCMRTGCPAIRKTEDGFLIDPLLCTGCGLCVQQCRFAAIRPVN